MRFLFTVFVLMAFGPMVGQAQIERQHAAHVHGQGQASLAFDGPSWTLFLELPGFNVVGFEHPPNTEQQQQTLDEAIAFLEGGTWLSFNPEGQCRLSELELLSLGYASTDHDAHHDHDPSHHHGEEHDQDHNQKNDHAHNGEHAHDHDHEYHNHDKEHAHARFQIEASGECENTNRLAWWSLGLFDGFPNNESLTVAVLTQTQAFEAVLTPNQQKIVFQ